MTLRIRPALHGDLPALRALLVETWHHTYDDILGRDEVDAITGDWHSLEKLAQGLSRPQHVFLIAEVDGRVSGTASATLVEPDGVTLDRLYVLPVLQRQGIGGALLAAIRNAFPQARRMRLQVERRNGVGLNFYMKTGFTKTGALATCGGHADALVLEREWP